MIPTDLVTPKAAARLLHTHPSTVYRLIHCGKLRAYQIGTARFQIRESDVLALLAPVQPRRMPQS